MVAEVVAALALRASGVYLDCTFGRGGHAREILKRLGSGGRLLALDRDPEAVAAGHTLAAKDGRLQVVHASFGNLASVTERAGFAGAVDGVLMDLGVSSPQLDDPSRGFGFRHDGPLDMRMDPGRGESAADWLARSGVDEIAGALRDLGDERHARRIARALVRAREQQPITTTARLAALVAAAAPGPHRPGHHPATRTFQAIRIAVNRELEQLAEALEAVPAVLAPGGRLAVLTFHSLEDRAVKRFVRSRAKTPGPRKLPVAGRAARPDLVPVGRAARPGEAEIAANPRARSATLRVAEKAR